MDIPILMPNQLKPFNGDTFIEAKFLELREKHNLKNAVETGSCFGGTTEFLYKNFGFCATIEKNLDFYNILYNRIGEKSNLTMINGDSSTELIDIIDCLITPNQTIFFLDAHWEMECPLLQELIQIAEDKIRPVIAIHDFVVPFQKLQFDSYNGQEFTFDWIKPYIDLIYGADGYIVSYNSEVESAGAKVGIIYIEPK